MKKKIFMILTAALISMTAVFAQGKPVVVVVPFDAKNVSQDDVDIISDVFLSEYTSTNKATVVDRSNFDKIKAQQKFELSDWSDSAKVTELGKALNAHQIITGQISQFGSQLVISIKLTDIKTTELLATTTKRVANMDLLFDECSKLAKDLSLKAAIPVEYPIGSKGPGGGTVYAVEGDWRWEVSGVSEKLSNNYKSYYNYISNGYMDWEMPTAADARLIDKNLVKQGIILADRGLWIYDSSASGGTWDPCWKYYSFSDNNNSSTSVFRAVRKFNVNDTEYKDPIIGLWNVKIYPSNLGQNLSKLLTNSKFADKFPLEFQILFEEDGRCRFYYYKIKITHTYYTAKEKIGKPEQVWADEIENVVISSLEKKENYSWKREYSSWDSDLKQKKYAYHIYDDAGNIIAYIGAATPANTYVLQDQSPDIIYFSNKSNICSYTKNTTRRVLKQEKYTSKYTDTSSLNIGYTSMEKVAD